MAAVQSLLETTASMRHLRTRLVSNTKVSGHLEPYKAPKGWDGAYVEREIATLIECRLGYNASYKEIARCLPSRTASNLCNKFSSLNQARTDWSKSEEDDLAGFLREMVRKDNLKPWQIN